MANMLCGPLAEEEHVQEAMQWRELGEQLKQSMSQLPGPSRPARNPKQSGQAPQPPAQQEGQRPEAHSQSISLGEVPTGMLIGSMDMGSRATPASGSPLNSCSDLDEEDPTRASSGPSFKHMAVPAEYQSGVANNGAAQHPNVAAVHGHGRAPLHRSSALGVGAEAQNQQKTVLEHNSSFDSQKTFVAKAPDENEGPKPWSDPDNTPLSMSLTVALPGSRFPAEDDQQTPSTAPAGAASKVNFHAAPVPRPAEHGSDSPAFQRSNSVPAIPRIRSTPRSMSMLSSSRRDVLLQELASRESRSGSNTPRSSVGSPMHRRTISQGNRSVGSTPGGGDSRSRLWLSLGGTSPA